MLKKRTHTAPASEGTKIFGTASQANTTEHYQQKLWCGKTDVKISVLLKWYTREFEDPRKQVFHILANLKKTTLRVSDRVSEIESGSLPSESLWLHLRDKWSRKAITIPLWPSWVTAISGHLECLLFLPPFEQVLHKSGSQFPLAGNDQQTKAQLHRKIWYSYSKRGDTNQCEGAENLYQDTLPRTLHYKTAWSI